jgi:predicted CopG family antitoxin
VVGSTSVLAYGVPVGSASRPYSAVFICAGLILLFVSAVRARRGMDWRWPDLSAAARACCNWSVLTRRAWLVYGLCMATKTISIETDAYDLLAQEKKDRTESFSRVIRRLFAERPALTAGDLLDVMQELRGKGAGARRKRR